MTKLVWHPDRADNLVQPLALNGEEINLTEGYAHWFFRYADEYRRVKEMEKADDADFKFYATISYTQSESRDVQRRTKIREIEGNVREALKITEPLEAISAPLPLRKSSVGPDEPWDPSFAPISRGITDKTVLVGLIDDSFNPAHQEFLFRNRQGRLRCRFESLWVQDAPARRNPRVRYGREIKPAQVERLLNHHPHLSEGEILDRLRITRKKGREYSPTPLDARFSHGCHVASIASGYGPDAQLGVDAARHANDIRLIGVQLPVLASQDSSGATQLVATFDAIHHIFDRASRISCKLGKAIPLILNFSYGLSSGARNGDYILEAQLKAAIERYKKQIGHLCKSGEPYVEVTLPAGNSHLTQTHIGTIAAQEKERQRLKATFRAPHEDRTSSFLELWVPRGATDISLTLTAPGVPEETFDISAALKQGALEKAWILAPETDCKGSVERAAARIAVDTPLDPLGRTKDGKLKPKQQQELYTRILLALAPTRRIDHDRPIAPAGDWRLSLDARVPVFGRLEGWILRDENVSNLAPRGRQSYFHSPVTDENLLDPMTDWNVDEYPSGDIRRNGTLSSLATVKVPVDRDASEEGEENADEASKAALLAEETDEAKKKGGRRAEDHFTIVGGGYAHNLAVAPYSAAGSARINSPDFIAPSETSRALAGVLGCGSRSGACIPLNGTSVASPQVTRLIAEGVNDALHAGSPPPPVAAILRPLTTGRPRIPSTEPEILTKRSARIERQAGRQIMHGEKYPKNGFHSDAQAKRMRPRFRAKD